MNSSNLEIDKVLVLSTAHITKKDTELISNDQSLVIYEMKDYGWLIYVNKDIIPIEIHSLAEYSIGFQNAVELAQNNDCKWLRFDRDGEIHEDLLPVYDW